MPPRKAKPAAASTADYRHADTRLNNPPAGLADIAPVAPGRKRYEYDPRLDPQLQWAGKAEHFTFDVETVPLHIHERISPAAILESLRTEPVQRSLFADPELDLSQAVEFYQHPTPWANRLILGDSLLVMNSLLERELMAGQVQCIYFDPPYGIKYGSNFQPITNKRDVKDGDDSSLTREPEQIKAFRDTWELGIHSYLTYMRDRLLLMREMLRDTGSIFVQISDENVHRVRAVMDEVFGAENFVGLIPFRKKTMPFGTSFIEQMGDFLIWYAKRKNDSDGRPFATYHRLFVPQNVEGEFHHSWCELPDGTRHKMTNQQINNHALLPEEARVYRLKSLEPSGPMSSGMFVYEFKGVSYSHPKNGYGTTTAGMDRLRDLGRLQPEGNRLTFIMYADENPAATLTSPWYDTVGADDKSYVVQTNTEVVKRCILMTTDPGDLVFDPTCGSGTTAFVAERWGRRWITCDTSRVALSLARQRILTATYPYYKLAHSEQGVRGAFLYKKVPHITLGSIANDEPNEPTILYDQPEIERGTVRVSGPFTVEAVQPPTLDPNAVNVTTPAATDDAGTYLDRMIEQLRRSGLTVRGQHVPISRIAALTGSILHAECDYAQGDKTISAAVVFGPQYGPLTSAQLQEALLEARGSYSALIAAAFTFDDQAHALLQKDNLRPPVVGVAINSDLLMGNLLKTSKASQVFSVFGKPDVKLDPGPDGYTVTIRGVDTYDPNTGEYDSSSADQTVAWFLDTDYDGATFLVRHAYFPSQTPNPWEKLSKALKGSIDPDQFTALQRATSLPFQAGKHRQCAVKVIDHRGNEVMTVLRLP